MQALFYSQAMTAVREAVKATDGTIGLEPIANSMEMDPCDLT